MKKSNIFTVPFRRKRQGRTYYKKRLKNLASHKFRFVVRRSLKSLRASLIEYNAKGDKVLFTIDTVALDKFGWKGDNGNLPSAYLVGFLAGKKALQNGVYESILDLGFSKSTRGSRIYAALAGAVDAGLKIPYNQKALPSRERLSGEHIAKYAESIKKEKHKHEKQFSNYIKRGLDPEEIVKHFNDIKGKING